MFDIVTKRDFKNLFDEMFDTSRFFNGVQTDIKEVDGKYQISANMAGFDKDDIKVELKDGYLTLKAEKQEKEEGDKDNYYLKESRSRVQRSFYVGKDFDENDFTAKFENGMLKLEFDKKEPKQIEVRTIDIT